jgi:hypothetical protein
MSYLNIALDKVRAIFEEEDALEPSIAASIFGYVAEHQNVRHINLGFVKQLCKLPHTEKSDVAVLKTLQALSGDAIGYLSVGFEYVDENEEIHNISRAAFVDAIQNSIDPFSGERAQDLARRVLIFYYPDESFPKRLIHE